MTAQVPAAGMNPDRAKLIMNASKEDADTPIIVMERLVTLPSCCVTGANLAPVSKKKAPASSAEASQLLPGSAHAASLPIKPEVTVPPLGEISRGKQVADVEVRKAPGKRKRKHDEMEAAHSTPSWTPKEPLIVRSLPILDPEPKANKHTEYLEDLLQSRPLHLSLQTAESRRTGYISPSLRQLTVSNVGILMSELMSHQKDTKSLVIPRDGSCLSAADGGISIATEGELLEDIWQGLTPAKKYGYCRQLRKMLNSMRKPNSVPSSQPLGSICSGGYSLLLDKHANSTYFTIRPHPTQGQFPAFLISSFYSMVPKAIAAALASQFRKDYKLVHTHGELCPKHIIVSQERIVAITGWDCAGLYPEWWEYVKFYESRTKDENDDWYSYISEIFASEFPNELAAYQGLVRCQRT